MQYTLTIDNTHESPFRMETVHASGEKIAIDAGKSISGAESAFSPMELVAIGLAGCSSIDVIMILRKAKQSYSDFQATVQASRVDGVPATFSHINVDFTVTGKVSLKRLERAAQLSMEKYCSVGKMLIDGGVKISHSCTVNA